MKKLFWQFIVPLSLILRSLVFVFYISNVDAQEIKNIRYLEDLETQSGSSSKISFEKDGQTLTGIIKPVRYINIKDIQSKTWALRAYQKMDSPCYRNSEYAVYLFDKFLGTGFVPETFVYIGRDNTVYSIQVWLEDREYGLWDVPDNMEAFDFITGNLDRFYDRNLIKSNGKLYAIDNEVAFPSDLPSTERFTALWKEWRRRPLETLKISKEMQEKIEYMDTDKLYEVLAPAIKQERHIDLMVNRIEYLKNLMLETKMSEKRIRISDGKNILRLIIAPNAPEDDVELVKAVLDNLLVQKEEDPKQFMLSLSMLGQPNVMDYLGSLVETNKDYEETTMLFQLTDLIRKYTYSLNVSKITSAKGIVLPPRVPNSVLRNNIKRNKGLKPR